ILRIPHSALRTSVWGGARGSSWLGWQRPGPNREARSSSLRGRRGCFSPPSLSPCCRSIPTRTGGSGCSGSARWGRPPRCPRRRSYRSSGPPAAARGGSRQLPPAGGVERLVGEFPAFAPGTTELQLFARDAGAAARAGRLRALRSAVQEITLRLKRPMLHHIIAVQPWSRLPERRYALIDFEP